MYSPSRVQRRYQNCKTNGGRKSILSNAQTLKTVKYLFLDFQCSPEEISAILRLKNFNISISLTTAYREIYAGLFDESPLSHNNRGVIRRLRHRGKTRHSKNFKETCGKIRITNSINERPTKANKRLEIGHWELDTAAGRTGRSYTVTTVDRKSRYTFNKKSFEPVTRAIIELLKALLQNKIKIITPDRVKSFQGTVRLLLNLKRNFIFLIRTPHDKEAQVRIQMV